MCCICLEILKCYCGNSHTDEGFVWKGESSLPLKLQKNPEIGPEIIFLGHVIRPITLVSNKLGSGLFNFLY